MLIKPHCSFEPGSLRLVYCQSYAEEQPVVTGLKLLVVGYQGVAVRRGRAMGGQVAVVRGGEERAPH